MKIKSPAKINLFLKIAGLRQDGFHNLQTAFAFVDLFDEIIISPAKKFNLKISGTFSHLIQNENYQNNLITKVIKLFSDKFSINTNFEIHLIKNIPIGGGLGGGSSNAASLMQYLNQSNNLNLTKIELQKLSLELGSDIAFFLEEKSCLMFGRGEILQRYYEFQPLPALIVNPNIHLATADIFHRLKSTFDYENAKPMSKEELQNNDLIELGKKIGNDLTKIATTLNPQIAKIIAEISAQQDCQFAAMSGSGASCFGIFNSENTRNEAFNKLQKTFPDYFLTKVLIKDSNN